MHRRSSQVTRPDTWAIAGVPSIRFATVLAMMLVVACGDDKVSTPQLSHPSEMVLVSPGTFMMGNSAEEPGSHGVNTLHEVTLTRRYYVSRCEVTQGEWRQSMHWDDSFFDGEKRPVETVTWFDAVMYCNALSTKEGLTPVYSLTDLEVDGHHVVAANVTWDQSALGYRLLTEAEWEYACRAGSSTAFCNGPISFESAACKVDSVLDAVGWYCGNSGAATHDVGTKAANSWGLYDMHGNVEEWCWDCPAPYSEDPTTDPVGGSMYCGSRVSRGGSWENKNTGCRSAYRDGPNNYLRWNGCGLRVARTAQ